MTDFDFLTDTSCDKIEMIVKLLNDHPEAADLTLRLCVAVVMGDKKNA